MTAFSNIELFPQLNSNDTGSFVRQENKENSNHTGGLIGQLASFLEKPNRPSEPGQTNSYGEQNG